MTQTNIPKVAEVRPMDVRHREGELASGVVSALRRVRRACTAARLCGHIAAIADEWRRASAAAWRHDELSGLDAAQLRRLGIRREDVARRVFDELYGREAWRQDRAASCVRPPR